MVDNWQLAESLRRVTEFTVTEDHLKLLRHAWVDCWYEGEGYGAPGINPKKPYGGSWVERDIVEILDIPSEDWDWEDLDEDPVPPRWGNASCACTSRRWSRSRSYWPPVNSAPASTGATPRGPSTGDATRAASSYPAVSYDQLGRSVLVHLARRAGTSALVRNVRQTLADRECPLVAVASGPCVAHGLTAPEAVGLLYPDLRKPRSERLSGPRLVRRQR
jgi:hypothetical protein